MQSPKDELIELYYQRILVMQNRIQELETKLLNYGKTKTNRAL